MFITFEGMEGSGKSSAMLRIGKWLETSAHAVVRTREPGGSALGKIVRSALLDVRNTDIVPKAELFLYLADRAQHSASVIRPALERGAFVLSDRYADSTIVYQGYARGIDISLLHRLNALAVDSLWPDLTLLFDVEVETGLERANARNQAEGKALAEGRFEVESLDFHTRVREGFLDWAAKNPARFAVIDGMKDRDTVYCLAKAAVEERMGRQNKPLTRGEE
ncbi:thymidylate kinase [Deltaproteobacteria bacterium]|nr:thymidylate kinase [Deltaproteobacteria bacterium]